MKRPILFIAVASILHGGITMLLLLLSFSHGMSRLETGVQPASWANVLQFIATFLAWPIVYPLSIWGGPVCDQLFRGLLGYIPLLLNSLTWGIAGWLIVRKIKNKRRFETSSPARV
jgi:hypothetical protein